MKTEKWKFWILVEDYSGELDSSYPMFVEVSDHMNVLDVRDYIRKSLEEILVYPKQRE